ncbi:MAG: PQQ-binding-like beta-propeller repeat protein [Acidobacteria bacterium]|nr:PQQ-binding-like beta-propeller repeat protein [Acidobacteriota bacterium]
MTTLSLLIAPLVGLAIGAQEYRGHALETTAETSANASLGDLDGDGDLDIVLAKGRHWPLVDQVLLNDGNGGFEQRHAVGGTADRTYTAALADLDGDGDLDIVVGNDRPDDKRIYLNRGDGHFDLSGTFGDAAWPTRNVTTADLDGDDRPEVIVANRGGPDNLSANYVCHNAGDATFPECTVLSRDSATTIAADDLTGDGFVDLFVPHRDGGQSYLYVNDGSGGFAERHAVGPEETATRAVALGDVTSDGLVDILVGDQRAGGVWLHVNRGGARFEARRPIGDRSFVVYSLSVADLDGDGHHDVVVGNRGAANAVLTNAGSGREFTTTRFGDAEGATYGLAIGDVDGDGRPDIAAGRSDAPNTLYVAERSGSEGTPAANLDNWPSWRGTDMDGMATSASIPVHFSEEEHVRWKVELPGRGASTPIIWGDTIFLQAAVPVGEPLEPRTPLEEWQRDGTEIFQGLSYVTPDRDIRFVLFALNRTDGSLRWQQVLRQEQPHEGIHPTNTWASASPVTDGERVIAYFGSRGLFALDMDGNLLWERDVGDMDTRKGWGEGSSAALHDGRVLVPWDHEGDSFLVALDAASGDEIWRAARDEPSTWFTPVVVSVGGTRHVVTTGANHVRGYDFETGELLWSGPGLTLNTIPTPLHRDGRIYLTSGYRGTAMLAIDLADARGEIETGGALAWRHDRDTPYVSSPLLMGNTLYFTKHLPGIISAVNAVDGSPLFGPERLPPVGEIYASPVATANGIFLPTRDGHVLVLAPGNELEIIANNQLDDGFDASPAIVGNEMYLRGTRFLYRIETDSR